MLVKLNFHESKANVVCTCCKKVKNLVANSKAEQTRLIHIFDFLTASLRSQGYYDGYICHKCEKSFNVSTRDVRKFCKNKLTSRFFRERENVHVSTG